MWYRLKSIFFAPLLNMRRCTLCLCYFTINTHVILYLNRHMKVTCFRFVIIMEYITSKNSIWAYCKCYFCLTIVYNLLQCVCMKQCGLNDDLSAPIYVKSVAECGHMCASDTSCSNFLICNMDGSISCLKYIIDGGQSGDTALCGNNSDDSVKCAVYIKVR